ncbi:exodeoxyribonuclease V subunit gamma [Arcticibacter eurypsychrophilus]|uniref:exodeoxyribonuclease V subunit gamma n=1 Tax=Arcticibacter eurypsychrophilus TaxID=1434752 RepID=UPI00084E00F9|nr:exodeoxyribonuclease V subunit gamma [Arcticibacter eurypsychrophilus]
MALHLQVSNSLAQLAKRLCVQLKHQEQGVFQPHILVTQTDGMNNWLKLQFAEHMGIAANYRFFKPSDIINQIYYLLGGKGSGATLSADNISWLLYTLLADPVFIKRFPAVSDYYNYDGPDKEVKRMGLADKIADLFDQYQIYRPEMIVHWNETDPHDRTIQDWQQYLWAKARVIAEVQLPDKTLICDYIIENLKRESAIELLRAQMPAIHVFGLSITTGYHLTLFYEIARYLDFSFHILNPAPSVYWFEDKSEKQLTWMKKKGFVDSSDESLGNPLLTSWGRVIQNTFHLFFQNEEMLNVYDEVEIEEPEEDSLLHKIQHDIFFNFSQEDRSLLLPEDLSDGSVTINSCFTPVREVEVLYNYLIHLIDQRKETLSPRDIVVMVSDIDAYAPYIKAVFSNAPYKFQYTIADENFTSTDTISNALHALLSLNEQNFKAEEVLQILDSGYIRKRFGITDLQLIRNTVNKANIRFGMDGELADDTIYVSWEYGIQRMMFGICMLGEEEYGTGAESFYPLDSIEGSASYEIIRFCHFVEILMNSVRERKRNRTIADWVVYMEYVLQNLVWDPEEGTLEDYELLLGQLEKYNMLTPLLTEVISYEVFSHQFLQSISGATRAGSFVQGGITFCSLIPMRSIPFKVVALMGLNFDQFPRKETPVSFNLLEKDKRRGDRNVKENDKHLFLETILSADQYFYISYIGQSAKDNTVVPPSALVDELIDYIESGTENKAGIKEKLVTRHPLHSFSQKYQQGDSGFYTYLNQKIPANRGLIDRAKVQDNQLVEQLSLDKLVSFFKNPIKGYYNQVLGIYYNTDAVLLPETELFDLDALQFWSLKQDLLRTSPEEASELKKRLVKTGGLPLKSMADITLSKVEQQVVPMRDLFNEVVAVDVAVSVPIELTVKGMLLKGTLRQVYGQKLVSLCWSKHETKYLVEASIRYLVAQACGLNLRLYFISAIHDKIYEGMEISQADALSRLEELVDLYQQGQHKILTFYPDFEINPLELDALNEGEYTLMVKNKFNDPSRSYDVYAAKEYDKEYFTQEGVYEEFIQNAEQLLVPLTTLFPTYYL